MSPPALGGKALDLVGNISRVIKGDPPALQHVVVALLAGGHVLLEDAPGLGKTVLARSLARSIALSFARVQGTPDLLPTDLTGVQVFNQKNSTFQFRSGPLHHNIVLVDEINRATPKTQSALLEAMEERQVSVDGTSYPLPLPYLVIATQNPIELEGTYPLPEAQLDRFLLKTSLGYPDRDAEVDILREQASSHPLDHLEAILSSDDILAVQRTVRDIAVSEVLMGYIVDLVRHTRGHGDEVTGVSPRGGLALRRASQALAYLRERSFVTPEDIQDLALVTLSHRIYSRLGYEEKLGESMVRKALKEVRVPV